MSKPRLISGIQPTGRLHLGNYLGALKNHVALQNSGKYQCFFFIADLHSLTTELNPQNILNLTADYLAAGLDPKKSTIFLQSQIPAHAELTWILNTITPIGELRRMTQFKEKANLTDENKSYFKGKLFPENITSRPKEPEAIFAKTNVGLFDYPVLMAADVILYDAKFVPIGDDQVQHLELTRTIVRNFNKKFGKTFVEPQPILNRASRIMSLGNPAKKMSKSQLATCLFIDDSQAEIKEKIKRAVTDSGSEIKFDRTRKPAISNLLTIYSELEDEPIEKIEVKFKNSTYADFKKDLAELVVRHFEKYRQTKKSLKPKTQYLKTILRSGSKTANKIASKKIEAVKKKVTLPL